MVLPPVEEQNLSNILFGRTFLLKHMEKSTPSDTYNSKMYYADSVLGPPSTKDQKTYPF